MYYLIAISDMKNIENGVPQGRKPGPCILFIIYQR